MLAARVGRLSNVGTVPVLDIDGRHIQDSTRIARYLDERHPALPLYPVDPQQRAHAPGAGVKIAARRVVGSGERAPSGRAVIGRTQCRAKKRPRERGLFLEALRPMHQK
nr:glutathione S-transferase N-terminal domain-containing protein [Panacagrimonas perspica]